MKTFLYILLSILLFSCTDEPDLYQFRVDIKNISKEVLKIKAFSANTIVFKNDIDFEENSQDCSYIDESFRGYFPNECNVDSLVLSFNNTNVGYICTATNSGNFVLSGNRNPLLPNGGFETEGKNYHFLITQEDYENAYELPE